MQSDFQSVQNSLIDSLMLFNIKFSSILASTMYSKLNRLIDCCPTSVSATFLLYNVHCISWHLQCIRNQTNSNVHTTFLYFVVKYGLHSISSSSLVTHLTNWSPSARHIPHVHVHTYHNHYTVKSSSHYVIKIIIKHFVVLKKIEKKLQITLQAI